MDLVIGLERENIIRGLRALKSAGWQTQIPVSPEEFARAKWEIIVGKIPAPVVSCKTLLAMKKEAGRDKDLLDIEQLKKIDPYR